MRTSLRKVEDTDLIDARAAEFFNELVVINAAAAIGGLDIPRIDDVIVVRLDLGIGAGCGGGGDAHGFACHD